VAFAAEFGLDVDRVSYQPPVRDRSLWQIRHRKRCGRLDQRCSPHRGLERDTVSGLTVRFMNTTASQRADASWSVGELSSATGLSVRVLRHWEQLGLVTPARTATGHRRYGAVEITRLYRALALRRTGLSLRQIATLLHDRDPNPTSTLRAHLAELDEDLRRRSDLRDRLARVLADLDCDADGHDERGTNAQLLMKVIETMTMFEQYVHGYRSEENLRLHDQADTLVELLHGDTEYPSGSTVLEVGCGVGAQTVSLAEHSPGARITAVDISTESLAAAEKRVAAAGIDTVTFAQADVTGLPHSDGALAGETFDHVFVCFLLEHLPRPVEALTRLRSMLEPGGSLTVIEGDHGSTYFHPDSHAARDAVDCQVTLQRHAGGDALVGRRLYPLLTEAGCHDVSVSPRMVYVDASRPELVDGFIRKTFIAMIAGVREPAIAAGLIDADRFDAGIHDLERTAEPDGVFCYTFFKATATR
jgi:DNA-binding transcriptional MerR regulator/trans-aconitate methyltransferase